MADGDLVVQHRPSASEGGTSLQVALVVLDAYVLHHADRADTVEVVLRHLAVVLHTHFGQILQPFTGDPFVGVRGLFLERVTPSALMPRRAAVMTIEPQPQPMSSKRWPGCKSSLSRIRRSLLACASSRLMCSLSNTAQV